MDTYHRDKLQEGLLSLEAHPMRVEGFDERVVGWGTHSVNTLNQLEKRLRNHTGFGT